MKTKPLRFLAIALAVVWSCLPDLHARSIVLLEPKDFFGTWLGYSDDGLQFSRLELVAGGKGFMTISYLPNTPVRAYRVSWSLNNVYGFTIALKPVDTASEPVTLKSVPFGAAMSQLTFEIRGKDWNRKLLLFNETQFQARSTNTADRMKKLRDDGN